MAAVSAQIVSSIDIRGHQHTQEYIIRREIQHKTNITLDSILVEQDRNRIDNLGIFSSVTWQSLPMEDGTVKLRFHVIESTRVLPIFAPQYEEGTGWSLVLGSIVNNFRGKNESLVIGGLLGGIDAYGIEFLNPWIMGDHVSLGLEVGKHYSDHIFLPYTQQTSSFELNVGRYFGYEKRISAGFEYEKKKFVNDNGDSMNVAFQYFAPQGSFTYDSRDFYNDPSRGIHIIQFFQSFHYLNRNDWSLFWDQSYSTFFTPLKLKKKLTVGIHARIRSVHGEYLPELLMYGLGGAFSVRGWKMETRSLYSSGEQNYRFGYYSAVSSLELRQTIIPRFSLKHDSPFGPMSTELGLQGVIFFDAGSIGYDWQDLLQAQPMLGAGFGIRIPLAVVGNIRFDYGWSFYDGNRMESSFHLAVGQKF